MLLALRDNTRPTREEPLTSISNEKMRKKKRSIDFLFPYPPPLHLFSPHVDGHARAHMQAMRAQVVGSWAAFGNQHASCKGQTASKARPENGREGMYACECLKVLGREIEWEN